MDTIKFRKKQNLESLLLNYSGIYDIDSLVDRSLKYGISDGKFAILSTTEAKYCEICEMPKAAEENPKLREEILAIYGDVRDLGLERVWR